MVELRDEPPARKHDAQVPVLSAQPRLVSQVIWRRSDDVTAYHGLLRLLLGAPPVLIEDTREGDV